MLKAAVAILLLLPATVANAQKAPCYNEQGLPGKTLWHFLGEQCQENGGDISAVFPKKKERFGKSFLKFSSTTSGSHEEMGGIDDAVSQKLFY